MEAKKTILWITIDNVVKYLDYYAFNPVVKHLKLKLKSKIDIFYKTRENCPKFIKNINFSCFYVP